MGQETFVEVDKSLYVVAAKLRDALEDEAATPRYIKTVSGRGYRFIGEVTPVPDSASIDSLEQPALLAQSGVAGRVKALLSLRRTRLPFHCTDCGGSGSCGVAGRLSLLPLYATSSGQRSRQNRSGGLLEWHWKSRSRTTFSPPLRG